MRRAQNDSRRKASVVRRACNRDTSWRHVFLKRNGGDNSKRAARKPARKVAAAEQTEMLILGI